MYDPTSRKDIRRAEKAYEALAQQRTDFLCAALSTVQGRAWFYHFLSECGALVIAPCFEPNRDYFDQGQRNVGLRILNEILTHCPEQYTQMRKEEYVRLQSISPAEQRTRSPRTGWDVEGRDAGVDDTPNPDLDSESILGTEAQ
jgi:hypothetical protein